MLPLPPPPLQAEIDSGVANLERTSIPAFVNIYRYLTTQILEHDGSSQATNKEYEATGIVRELYEIHVQASRSAILLRTLIEICSLDPKNGGLPGHLRELCYVVSAYLSTIEDNPENTNNEIEELMAEELTAFRENLPTVTKVLSRYLTDLESTTTEILELLVKRSTDTTQTQTTTRKSRIPSTRTTATTTTTRNYKSTTTPTTSSSSSLLKTHQQTQSQLQSSTLPTTLSTLSTTLSTLLTTQSHLLTSHLRHAELHTHSTQSRHTTSHATFLSSVAQGLSLKTQILALQREKEVYAEKGVREALRRKHEELVREERGLGEREQRLRRLLGDYEDAGGRKGGMEVFERLGEGYGAVEREIEAVRRDVERLEVEMGEGGGGRGVAVGKGRRR